MKIQGIIFPKKTWISFLSKQKNKKGNKKKIKIKEVGLEKKIIIKLKDNKKKLIKLFFLFKILK